VSREILINNKNMENLFKNVKVLRIRSNENSVDFEIQLPNRKKIFLMNCQMTHDFPMLGLPFICLVGYCEYGENEIHYKKGILRAYGKPFLFFRWQKFDLLLND
jgi:hypothetical protein